MSKEERNGKRRNVPRHSNGRYAQQKSGGPASGMKASGRSADEMPKNLHPPLKIPSRVRITGLQKVPADIKIQNKLADELVEWAFENKQEFTLNKFPLSKHYDPYKFFNLAKKNQYFKDALSFARYVVIDGMLEVNLKDSTNFTMREYLDNKQWWDKHYADHYNEMIERRKKGDDGARNTTYTIIREPISTDVPPCKEED